MTVTMKEVRAILDPEEPDYSKVKALGPDALPVLKRLVRGNDAMLAAKAASAAGVIGGPRAVAVIDQAARSSNVTVRIAAAWAAKQVAEPKITEVLLHLLSDDDSGVRRQALRAAADRVDPLLRERLHTMTMVDKDAGVRAEATALLQRTPRTDQ